MGEYKATVITKETMAMVDRLRGRKAYEQIGRIVTAVLFQDEDLSDIDCMTVDVITMLRVGSMLVSDAREKARERNKQRVQMWRERNKMRSDVMPSNEEKPLQTITNDCNAHVNVNEDVNEDEDVNVKKEKEKRKETPTSDDVIDEWFEEFWEAYPTYRRVDKRKCKDKFKRIIRESKDYYKKYTEIIDGLKRWKESYDWNKDDGQFVCAPLVWLNNERWEATPNKIGGNNGKNKSNTTNQNYQNTTTDGLF